MYATATWRQAEHSAAMVSRRLMASTSWGEWDALERDLFVAESLSIDPICERRFHWFAVVGSLLGHADARVLHAVSGLRLHFGFYGTRRRRGRVCDPGREVFGGEPFYDRRIVRLHDLWLH